ncbi:Putative NAD(P)H nitroreductase YdjA [Pseudomonas fluorescens]|uniref:nitroreductase family protein n=1 Tax=Pseudomonas fluorescens TaxID=294 RepID=UPI00125B3FA7|nr:nitroreductase family protein [Pseudomonas fluorescens]CAG8871531.1 Putative NAD(P)H nitroreductase YdjA [Pseudomonas fluorescens]VVP82301.1 Putative NAD(P)H nitroreductase YdjA [Pseudomonas fluorescens]
MEALDALLNRVSVPRLTEPAPSAAQREALFQAALRAPDHGQLRPWRFLTVEGAAREKLGELFAEAVQRKGDASQGALDKARAMPLRAPLLIVVIARLQDHYKVPKDEQRLAAGCAAHGILIAAHAQGIGAVWRTGDMAHDAHVLEGLGLEQNEELLGYLYVGTPLNDPRPAPVLQTSDFVSEWSQGL